MSGSSDDQASIRLAAEGDGSAAPPDPQRHASKTVPLNVNLVTVRDQQIEALYKNLKEDRRCRVVRPVTANPVQGLEPLDVDVIVLDHLLHSDFLVDRLYKQTRRASLVILLKQNELLQAADALTRADGILFADAHAACAVDVMLCAAGGYWAFPQSMGYTNPFKEQRLERARALTPFEFDLLRQLAIGRSNRAIADLTGMSEARIKAALRTLLKRLCLNNRTEAAVFFVCNRTQIEGGQTGADHPSG